MKTAICQVADTGPLESLVCMLQSAGYHCYIPSEQTKIILRRIGCDTVLDIKKMVDSGSYDPPTVLPVAPIEMMNTADLFVDIKAQRNAVKIWDKWPHLKDKILWYRINGGEPMHISDSYGDEVDPPCPILTPNLWYATEGKWSDKAYACWPPFYRFDDYMVNRRSTSNYGPPICLVHNLRGWGYHVMQDGMEDLGVRMYGDGSPDGPIKHKTLPDILSRSIAMVHLKNNDAPGYALYEALAAACPLIVSQRLIIKNRMQDLFEDRITCLVFDRVKESKVHHSHTKSEIETCVAEVKRHLATLCNSTMNIGIGKAGRARLNQVMWNSYRDSKSLRKFMGRMYP